MVRWSSLLTVLVATAFLPPVISRAEAPPAPSAARSITVTGIGTAPGAVSGAVVAALVRGGGDAAGLQRALRDAGVQEFVDDRSPITRSDRSIVGVRGRVPQATREAFDAIADGVRAYAKQQTGAEVVAIRFFGLAVDCPSIAEQARALALTDAQQRAEEIARASGLQLGAKLRVVESGGCPPPGRLGGAYAIDPQTLQMRVEVREAVTFSAS